MQIIDNYLQEIAYKDYTDDRIRELKKKAYKSNDYLWVYIGGPDHEEIPLHVLIWNKHNPHSRVKPNDGNLIHHKDGNKENNAPSNLIRTKKCDHDRDHLTKRRKDKKYKKQFSKETSAKGGRNAHKKHPELIKNLKHKKKK